MDKVAKVEAEVAEVPQYHLQEEMDMIESIQEIIKGRGNTQIKRGSITITISIQVILPKDIPHITMTNIKVTTSTMIEGREAILKSGVRKEPIPHSIIRDIIILSKNSVVQALFMKKENRMSG